MVRPDDEEIAFNYYLNKAQNGVDLPNPAGNVSYYPQIATLIQKDFQTKWLENREFRKNHSIEDNQSTAYFKIDIAKYLKRILLSKKPFLLENPELKKLKQINNRNIAGIITTNYDELLEFLFPQLQPYVGQDELLVNNIAGINEIYKIHGGVSDPLSIVITHEDYQEFEKKQKYLIAKLLTIFLENPIVFLGYSISDLNIKKILEDVAQCIPEKKREDYASRFIFVEWISPESTTEESVGSITFEFGATNISMTQIRLRSFTPLYEALAKVSGKYSPKILQQLKQDIYQLVLTQQPTEKMLVQELDTGKIPSNIEFVIGVGVISQFGEKGIKGIQNDEIYEDIVMDTFSKKYAKSPDFYQKIFDEIYIRIRKRQKIPFYKYLQFIKKKDIPENIKIDQTIEELSSNTDNQKRGTLYYHSIGAILSSAENRLKCIYKIKQLREEEIDLQELENLLKGILKENPINTWHGKSMQSLASNIRGLIRLYDWMKYKKGDR